jgi:hypothetical protein
MLVLVLVLVLLDGGGSSSRCEPASNAGYSVTVVERTVGLGGGSVISKANGSSGYAYNMNAAYFPAVDSAAADASGGGVDGLIVRVGNRPNYGPTGLAAVRRVGDPNTSTRFEFVDSSRLIVPCPTINGSHSPHTASAPCADDPRIAYRPRDETYYMTYGNDSGLDKNMSGRVQWIATSKAPWIASSWTFHHPITQAFKLTSGASLIIRDDAGPGALHYAILTAKNTAGGLYTATSTDLLNWHTNASEPWCVGRRGMFDQKGMASGPQAERLSDGNYL